MSTRCGLLWKYRTRLPLSKKTPLITLNEGGTPLVAAPKLAQACGFPAQAVHLKIEGANPTGSFKDRGMTFAVSKAVEEGARGVLCASTGNTAASAAAYAARAGLRCLVLLPAGGVALGKLTQSLMAGAQVVEVRGNFDDALRLARQAARTERWTLVNSTNPYRLEGQKTGAFEIIEDLGRAPDYQFMPVGNAGNITAYWMGYVETHKRRKSGKPKMMGWQAAGAAPIVRGRPVANPKTIASAIRIGDPVSWKRAEAARDDSGGLIEKVTDREILHAYKFLAQEEGVFCEPSSAAGPAGLIKWSKTAAGRRARRKRGLKIVCILTGNGLKDPETPKTLPMRRTTIPARLERLRGLMRKRPA
jgi:threonine synthase